MEMPVVKNILDTYWNWQLPVQVEDIARHLGIYISELNSNNPEHFGLSGLAEIINGSRFAYFNRGECRVRQRFTLAHEIGHHMLGHVTPQNPKHRDDLGAFSGVSNDWEEREANAFAAELLMPKVAIEYMVLQKGISDISQLAHDFEVSESAMYYRLKNLGLLTY
ncbi:TPA: ImmA/IrrE family metallo-endopeptidase [Vibrio parahaemolyticus]|nr:ImmA/IrrE family metallo-endopeptidase [Vibrio parahaemolyticus]EIO4563539.1 ImmA/IrrE family metallo-endopeptidase [Vibrio parahaemolyticus]MBE3816661.1 ImmA/IrrE family metallo-endopeptidase [Vibrio parahaemolyticus]MBE4177607.1 ImmA/IrrE family metallo-endopeptidase [Vibrio parahaemolyticus]MBE4281686.1 ImmA/IrrE family metallo-endopeptidase [Vibrio parahaemolyticus]MBE4530122.1 ImmA/IrrE family metallo-endopeptidase [Vibrio parahaemolyticus]